MRGRLSPGHPVAVPMSYPPPRIHSGAQGLAGGSAYAFSPEPQEEDKGHQEGHQGDAVAQVVDDDGNVVVHFALLLRQERGQR